LPKSCQKVAKKLTKGSAMYHWSFYVSREAIKRKNQQRWWGGWVGANSSSKAFGISFADRPKAKRTEEFSAFLDHMRQSRIW
jgi:hypothetical protein